MRLRSVVLVCLFAVALGVLTVVLVNRGDTARGTSDSANRVVLANGATVLLYPVPGADWVAVESFYRTGCLHEPKGMTQAAHLVEHLICRGATASYAPGEAMALLSRQGMANAETLADFTHFDYVLPAGELALALKVEGERLSSLKITPELVQQEAPKCHAEADTVERNPRAGMLKFAFMAFGQAWRHGAGSVRIRRGLERLAISDLERFHKRAYRPQDLLLVVVGGVSRATAMALLNEHLGSIPRRDGPRPESPPWMPAPKTASVTWDSKVRAVCVAYPPPAGTKERLLLSLWGNLLMQRLMADGEVQAAADAVFCTNQSWSVGTLPFFMYATAKPDVSLQRLGRLLTEKLEAAAEKPNPVEMNQVRMMAAQLSQEPELKWDAIRRQAESFAAQMGQPPERAAGMVLGNTALQLGLRQLMLGDDRKAAADAQGVSPEALRQMLRQTLDPSQRWVTMLIPS